MMCRPTSIVACPECSAGSYRVTMLSGNTFRASRWSDGKLQASMLYEEPELVRCRACGSPV